MKPESIMNIVIRLLKTSCLALLCCLLHPIALAQTLINKKVTLHVKKMPLREVLVSIGKQNKCYFSYNTSILPGDSLVSISIKDQPVKTVLETLIGRDFQFKETEQYIIIQPADREKWFTISGHIEDGVSGGKLSDVSVIEEQQLVSCLTDENGYFKLRLRDHQRYQALRLRVSKGFYRDTVITVGQGVDQQLVIPVRLEDNLLPDVQISQYGEVERTWFGRHFFPLSLRKQSTNLVRFFVKKPYQVSFIPGVGTHGKVSSQVTNKFSLNALAGYSAGVNGVEIGGVVNIDKRNVQGLQIAGISNLVGGYLKGVQVAGIVNNTKGLLNGLQISGIVGHVEQNAYGVTIAGISSHVAGNMKGLQISGIASFVRNLDTSAPHLRMADTVQGAQISGILNNVQADVRGMQLAGITNICRGDVYGVQACGILNVARKVKGLQLGLINIADTVDGACLGVFNIIKKGYHKLSVNSNETFNTEICYKMGTEKLYSKVLGAANLETGKLTFAYGYGLGNLKKVSKQTAASTEIAVYQTYFDGAGTATLVRLTSSFHVSVTKKISLFAGAAVAYAGGLAKKAGAGYRNAIPEGSWATHPIDNNNALWLGWQVGVDML